MNSVGDPGDELTSAEWQDLHRLAGFMMPANTEYGVPGADDEAIFADIGYGWDHGHSRNGTTLASVGCGLLYTLTSHVEGEIYFGVPLTNRPTGDVQRAGGSCRSI